jgi:hypothetical protein
LTQRLVAAERDGIADWMQAVEALPGNPLGAAVRPFGQATATTCGIPAQVFNRVFGMTEEDAALIPDALTFYRERGAEPLFDVNPYAVRPCSTLLGRGKPAAGTGTAWPLHGRVPPNALRRAAGGRTRPAAGRHGA